MRLNIFNQKILALVLTIAALMTGQTAWAVLTWTGNGSSDNPYQIDTYEKLKEFAVIVNGTSSVSSSNTSACAILTADIECTDNTWTPIGNNERPFMGTFDGDGHTITGLSNAGVNSTPKSVGLFGNVGSPGNVKEVILVDVALSGKNSIGSIAGYNRGNVQKCYVANSSSGSISATENSVGGIGGIVGYNKDGTIQNCHYSGSGAISANNNLGGIVGYNEGGTVNCCYYAGKGAISCSNNVGGIIGLNSATATNCYYNKNNTTLTKAIGNADDTGNVKGLTAAEFQDISNFTGFSTNVWIQGIVAPLLKGMPYTISFNANEGTGSMANQTVTSGSSTTLSANTFTRSGYLFTGWNTKADGKGVPVAADAQAGLVGPETLYAQWALASGNCGDTDVNDGKNVTWAVTDTNGDGTYETITISGNGAMADYYSNSAPWAAFKDVLTTAVIGDGVTSIGGKAFYQFTKLTSVTIASSVTSIGAATFYECTNLATINGASGVTNVGSAAFDRTAWINALPNGLTCVGHVAYKFKGDGTSVNLDAATTQIYKVCFQGSKITSIVIPASVESIEGYAFANSANLQKVYVLRHESKYPEITLLSGGNAFDYCSNLTAIIVPADAYDDYKDGWSSYESKLKNGYTVTCGTNITATSYAPIVAEGETVTLSANRSGYTLDSYSVNGTPIDGNTFTMPASDVIVTATWKKLLTNKDITIDAIADQTWNNGNAITPTVTVRDGSTNISGECDFAYSDNQNTGTATVTITAKAASTGYSSYTTTTFKIVPIVALKSGAVQILEDQDWLHGIIDGYYSGTEAVSIPSNIDVAKITFNRTFPTEGCCTLVLPFEVCTDQLTGVEYILQFQGMTYDENGVLTYDAVKIWDESMGVHIGLQPYTPYIVKMNSSTLGISISNERNFITLKATSIESNNDYRSGNWVFRGIYSYTVWNQGHADLGNVYGFAATAVTGDGIKIGDFVRATAGAYIYPLRACLYYDPLPLPTPRHAPGIDELPDRIPVRIVNADEVDEVKNVQCSMFNVQCEGNWFTLDGRRLGKQPTAKGLYIHGNNKIAIK